MCLSFTEMTKVRKFILMDSHIGQIWHVGLVSPGKEIWKESLCCCNKSGLIAFCCKLHFQHCWHSIDLKSSCLYYVHIILGCNKNGHSWHNIDISILQWHCNFLKFTLSFINNFYLTFLIEIFHCIKSYKIQVLCLSFYSGLFQ